MILKSEGERIKYATSPARDKKYTIIAYSKLIQDYSSQINGEVIVVLVQALLELCTTSVGSGFQMASNVTSDTEDLLVDGAIDQTFAF
jgi:hypothetical protein